jgi:ribosomal protein S18 acetylase RimI-like enzyme
MDQESQAETIRIRVASAEDIPNIAATFLESAQYHAHLDPERYSVPELETISARYQEARQHPADVEEKSITLVAEFNRAMVGFIDVRLERSPDLMHREMTYCHIAEIAVSTRYQNRGIGEQLLRAAEEWGRGQGATFASLEYHVANTRAAEFYQRRMGYRVAAITAIKRLAPE